MATYYTLLTKVGQASIANAVALNKPVNLTYMAVGDGNGNPTTPNENQTALVREKYRAQINQLTVDPENPNYLIAEMIIPTTVGGWSIYEVGVFDDQSQLVAIANFPATYKPELAEGSGRDLIVRIVIQVSNTSVVTLKVDPAVILASQAWVAANYVKKITVAGGTTGQVLAKNSNANEDFKWIDPTAAVQVIVDAKVEEQTLTTGQTIIDLAKLTTTAVAIYVEGVRLYPTTHYTINSNTRLTLKTSYPSGSKILAVQNDPTSTIKLATTTERGFTILSSATDSVSEEYAATPKAVKAAMDEAAKKALLAGSGTQQFAVKDATANNQAVSLSQMNAALALKALLGGDPAQAFQMANNGTGSYGVNNDRLNFVLQSYAALAGNQYTSFSVGGATQAAHAVRLDQFQSGSNGNGAWTKLPGGGQWCRQNLTLAANATTTWNFPASFVAAPAVFITAINGAFQCWLNGIGAANCGIYNNGAALNVNLLAIW